MEKRSRALVYLMVIFGTVVAYFYDATSLGKLDQFLRTNDELLPPMKERLTRGRQLALPEYEHTEEQLTKAHELGLVDRMLATTKEVWTECVELSMSALECKDFIDNEISTLFTGQDRFIPTRIIGKRVKEDMWYNAVVITMDDNDLCLGRDADGWIYYTFLWEGSGDEATPEQQAEIPPVNCLETSSGAAEGSGIVTVYTPDATANHPDPDAPVTTVPPPGSGPSNVDFSSPPIMVEPEPLLVQGATTDGAIAGEDDNPCNGGVILDGSAASTDEGKERLERALDEPPTIYEAGSRIVGPFDCRGMTGLDCCLLIKHNVRDSDVYGRAIQCHLNYDDTTCKKKWWLQAEEFKKVLIYANHNEMVSEDPRITGSWPQCEEKWDETRDWATKHEEGRCGKDFGDALCPEGQCCSAHGYCGTGGAWCDFGCQSQCWATSNASGLAVRERCGAEVGGNVCHGTYCCSSSGYCGSGPDYCEVEKGCQSQCWGGDVQELPPQIPEICKGELNVCIALDMSGSVCSPNFNNPTNCKNCPGECKVNGYDRDTCCPNFSKVKEFGTAVVNWINHLQFGMNHQSLSLVTFESDAKLKVGLGQDILSGLDSLDYSGGLTNHGDAIQLCQSTFDGSSSSSKNFILLVTDGVATTQTGSYSKAEGVAHGQGSAQAAKDSGSTIETVFINPAQAAPDVISYMNDLSSSGFHYDVSDFENLGKAVNDISYKIACSGDGSITPVAAPEQQASVPSALQDVTYCGCSSCTESVMNSYAGKHTCRKRIEWQMKHPRNKSEEKACRSISRNYPDVCKCSPSCDS